MSEGCVKSAKRLAVDVSFYDTISVHDMRKEVRAKNNILRTVQKECNERRIQWIEELAQDRAKAAGDQDWEQKMAEMKRTVQERQVNQKLRVITKGKHTQIDRVQIPTHDWFYSDQTNEVYHYDFGVWEAYPRKTPTLFFSHHTLKVLPAGATPVRVEQEQEGIRIVEHLPKIDQMWKDITTPEELEQLLLWRNKRHLQQTDREGGISDCDAMRQLRSEYGLSELNDNILAGKQIEHLETTEEMLDWFWAIQRPEIALRTPPVTGVITKQDYQSMFKNAREKTSSGGQVHYTLWKALAEQDDFAEFLCIMMSLPFMYGFVNQRWLHEVDVMLEKQKGIRMIHLLRIIGLLEADFNTALKFFFAKKMMQNAERIGLSDEQWGSRKNRSSIDAAMIKLLMFEAARVKKTTLAATYYDLVANYDRIRASISNLMAQRHMVDKNILRARAMVLERMRRHVKTGLGTSKETYGNEA